MGGFKVCFALFKLCKFLMLVLGFLLASALAWESYYCREKPATLHPPSAMEGDSSQRRKVAKELLAPTTLFHLMKLTMA